MGRTFLTVSALVLGAALCGSAEAVSLVGDTVNVAGDLGGGFVNLGDYEVVDPGREIEDLNLIVELFFHLDVSEDSITISLSNLGPDPVPVGPGYITVSDLDWDVPSELVGYSLVSSTFDETGPVTFTSDSISIFRTANNDLGDGQEWSVTYLLETEPLVPPVPEPATLSLLALGLAGLAARRKLRA